MTDLILSERVFDDALRTSAVAAEGINSTWHVLKSSNATRKILTSIADERSRVDLAYVRGLAAGHKQGVEVAASGTVFERALSHQKSEVRFARFRCASFTLPQEIATRPARPPRKPFHGRGKQRKADHVGFKLAIVANSIFVIANPFLESWPGDRRGSCSSRIWPASAASRALFSAVTNQT